MDRVSVQKTGISPPVRSSNIIHTPTVKLITTQSYYVKHRLSVIAGIQYLGVVVVTIV